MTPAKQGSWELWQPRGHMIIAIIIIMIIIMIMTVFLILIATYYSMTSRASETFNSLDNVCTRILLLELNISNIFGTVTSQILL